MPNETDLLKRQAEDLKKASGLSEEALRKIKRQAEAAQEVSRKIKAEKG